MTDETPNPAATAAAATPGSTPALTDDEKKKLILAEYHPDLCGLQEVEFGTKDRIHTQAHYRAQDDKEYFVFYTPQLPFINKVLYALLKTEKKFDGWGLIKVVESKPGKLPKIPFIEKEGRYSTSEEYDAKLKSSFGWNYMWFSKFADVLRDPAVIDRARAFRARADMHCYIASALNEFGLYTQDLDMNKLSVLTVDKEARIAFLRSMPLERYKNVEMKLEEKARSCDDDLSQVVAIDNLLDETKKIVQPRASTERQVDYCFALNRANYYLSRLEKDLRNKDLKTLEAMDKLRRKINIQLLEYRFMSEQNATPLFNIRIDHCKIIVKTEKHTMIFLEREQVIRFKRSLETCLDTKAQNITSTYSLDATAGSELRRIAEAINPETSDDILHEMDQEIADMKSKIQTKQLEGRAELLRIGLKVGVEAGKFAIDAASGSSGPSLDVPGGNPLDLISGDDDDGDDDDGDDDDGDALDLPPLGLLKGAGAGAPAPPLGLLKGAGAGAPALVENRREELDEDAILELVNLSEILPKDEDKQEENRIILANSVKQLQVTPENIDDCVSGFKCFVESKRLQAQADAMQKRRNKMCEKREYMIDFINMIKLYIQIQRGKFDERTDFEGVLIEEMHSFEKKNGNELFAEYTVRGI